MHRERAKVGDAETPTVRVHLTSARAGQETLTECGFDGQFG